MWEGRGGGGKTEQNKKQEKTRDGGILAKRAFECACFSDARPPHLDKLTEVLGFVFSVLARRCSTARSR